MPTHVLEHNIAGDVVGVSIIDGLDPAVWESPCRHDLRRGDYCPYCHECEGGK